MSIAQRDRILRTTVPYFCGPGFKTWPGEEIFLLPTVKCPYTRFFKLARSRRQVYRSSDVLRCANKWWEPDVTGQSGGCRASDTHHWTDWHNVPEERTNQMLVSHHKSGQDRFFRILCFVDGAFCIISQISPTRCTILFNIFIYFSSLHASGVHAPIIRRKSLYLCDIGTCHSVWVASGRL